jgi:hypothetical protein
MDMDDLKRKVTEVTFDYDALFSDFADTDAELPDFSVRESVT